MTDQSEHRGWEISNDYRKHYLDDPYFDFVDDDAEGINSGFWYALGVFALLIAALYVVDLWLKPPVVKFPPPSMYVKAEQVQPNTFQPPPGWRMECLTLDGRTRLIRPNWSNPNCTPQAARARGLY